MKRLDLKEKKARTPFMHGLQTGVKIAIVPVLLCVLGVAGLLVVLAYSRGSMPSPAIETPAPIDLKPQP